MKLIKFKILNIYFCCKPVDLSSLKVESDNIKLNDLVNGLKINIMTMVLIL